MVCQPMRIWYTTKGIYLWATGHAIRSNCALRACNHFYRCRSVREDENAVKTHDCVFPNRPNL